MKTYLLKRLLLIIPTLLVISMIAFMLSKLVPQDAAMTLADQSTYEDQVMAKGAYDKAYRQLGLDRPNFYFTILPQHYPASINQISDFTARKLYKKLLKIGMANKAAQAIATSDKKNELIKLSNTELAAEMRKTNELKQFFLPKLHWHGTDNQYHHWLSNFISGNLGNSNINGRSVSTLIIKALTWTFHLAIVSILFSFGIGIWLGYRLSLHPEGKKEQLINQVLYILYAVPTFWLATIMVVYFTTDDYGSWTNIFPSVGIDIFPNKSTLQQIWLNAPKLLLPVIIGSLGSISYLARILRRSTLDEMEAPYILTAYSKGLSKKEVIKKHALPNALLPVISIFAGAIPSSLASSVVIEVIFNIPGMGRLLFNSIEQADWNVVFAIILFIGLVTSLSYFLADILYAFANPKIRFA